MDRLQKRYRATILQLYYAQDGAKTQIGFGTRVGCSVLSAHKLICTIHIICLIDSLRKPDLYSTKQKQNNAKQTQACADPRQTKNGLHVAASRFE